MSRLSAATRLFASALLCVLAYALPSAAQSHVVISQVYGGGGNSAATYTNDFIELYNPGAAAVDISGYSIQYASSTGNSWNQFNLPAGATVQPKHYYLVKAAAGTTAAQSFTADFDISTATKSDNGQTFTINLSATAGKVALVNNHTALAGSAATATAPLTGATCPSTNASAVVDFVGYGAATCYEGASPAPAPPSTATNSTSLTRNASGADTDVNGSDFTTLTPPVPHNSSYSGTAAPLSVGSTTAAATTAGNTSLLSVTVTPGSTSTGIAVTANLTQIGGGAAQAFTLSATANTYTYTATVASSVAAGTYQLPVTVTDQQGGSASGSISITVQAPVSVVPIATLQGNRSTYVNTNVTTSGVVTVVTNAGFYMQTPSSTPGSTGFAEGLYVYAGTGKVPSAAIVGNLVQVTGSLSLYPAANASHTPSLELGSPAVTVLSTNQALPAAITLTASSLSPTGGIYQLTKYEGMLVKVASLTAISGTDGSLTENTETVASTGQFYAVVTGTARPFREPGMDFRDFPTTTCPTVSNCTATATAAGVTRPANLVLFDDNPERLIVESSLGGGTALDVSAGAVITNVTGVIDFSYATDVPYGDPARLILQPGTASAANLTPGISVTPLTAPTASQFTVAAFNVERFFNTNAADDLYYDPVAGTTKKSSAVDVTQDAYNRRLKKVSLAVRTILNNPDIISLEEVENLSVLNDIAAQIDADTTTGAKPGYVAYGTDSVKTFTDDIGGISIGFLVKPSTVDVTRFEQMGATSTFQASTGTQTLNDRPSDVLHAGIKRGAGATDYPITVISNHLRSLSGIGTSADTRLKKELQAEMLATLIQGYQTKGEHVIAVGDMNAFQFSDGYTDTMGTITGRVSPDGTAAQPGKAIVSPVATDLVTTLPAAQQQSYTEFGNAQVLDHVVVTADIAGTTQLAYAHTDADFPNVLYNDATTPARVSDHDVALAYLALPAPAIKGTLTGTATFPSEGIGISSPGQVFTLTNTGEGPITISGFAVTGDFAQTNTCGATLAVGATCAVNVVFKPTAAGSRTGTLTLNGNATIAAVALSGTGLTPDFSITTSGTATTINVTVAAGAPASATLTLSPLNGFSGSVTLACAATGVAPPGVTCTVPNSATVSASTAATVTVTLTTTARTKGAGFTGLPGSRGGRVVSLLLLVLGFFSVGKLRRSRGVLQLSAVLLTLGVASGLIGCSSSNVNPNGTPAGSYTYAVTATSGSTTHTANITITVQ